MKQFVFSLQPLYNMKKNIEKQQKIELQMIETQLSKRYAELESLNNDFNKAKREYCQIVISGVLAPRVKQYGHFFARLKVVMSLVQEKIKELEKKKEQCIAQLVETRREKKLLSTLREEKYSEYLDQVKKEQETKISDFVSYQVTVK